MMKTFYIIGLLIAMLLSISCGRNRLKTDEKKLVNQILTEEEQLAQQEAKRAEREKQLADSIAKLPKGFRFKEQRGIDPNNPPIIIDIVGSRAQNPQPVKLSQLFKKIEYIKLEHLQDTNESKRGFVVAPDCIYKITNKGSILQFDKEGHFIRTVCTGNLQFTRFNGTAMVTKEQADIFEGALDACWNGSEFWYCYDNRPARKRYLMTFKNPVEGGIPDTKLPGSVEFKSSVNGTGDVKADLQISKARKTGIPYLVGSRSLVCVNRLDPYDPSSNFFNVLSTSGDTLCEFKNFDPIRNYSKSVARGVDDGSTYYSNGSLMVRQAFNDTIYQLIPPNRLVPRHVLNFGDLGIKSAQEGVDPGVSLKEKLILQDFIETNQYIFITYSKDYDCPATAESGTLKFSRLVYDKKSETLTSIYINEAPFLSGGRMVWPQAPELNVENDLDKMPFKWPKSVTAGGQPFSTFSGKELLKQKNPDFPLKNISENDMIIAIYH